LTTSATALSVYTQIAHVGAAMFVALKTLDQAVRLVDRLSVLNDPAGFAPIVLPALAELLGCDVITYNEVGGEPASVSYEDWPPRSLDPRTNQTFARLAHQHPAIEHYRRTGDDRPVLISDFLTRTHFHRLELYADFFRPIQIEHQISFSLDDPGSSVVGIALNRSSRDFDDADRAVLTILRRPLSAALQRARLRQQAATSAVWTLSSRERELLELVALGKTNSAIARRLGISPRTVAKHLEHVYGKLGVSSRAAAVARSRVATGSDPS
jgi:DNA-binding CsgD family transcriptional regulator